MYIKAALLPAPFRLPVGSSRKPHAPERGAAALSLDFEESWRHVQAQNIGMLLPLAPPTELLDLRSTVVLRLMVGNDRVHFERSCDPGKTIEGVAVLA